MSSTRSEVITLLTNKLKILHVNPGEQGIRTYVLFLILSACRCIQLYYALSLIGNNTHSFVIMANGAKTFAANFQGVKQIALFREQHLMFLINNLALFWHAKEIENLEQQCKRFTKTFFNLVYVSYFGIILMPLTWGSLPFIGNYPTFPCSFWLFAFMQCFQFAHDSIIVLAVDCLFLCLCMFTYAQFKLLNKRILQLGKGKNTIEDAIACVKYHNFLLKFVQVYAELLSPALLIQYVITSVSVCIEIFVFTKQSPKNMIASVFYLLTLSFQLSMYCFPAQFVIDEALKTSDVMFNSNWYNKPELAKTFVKQIIRRAQREVKFTGGGLTEINREAFTNIFKWTLSLYTLMNDIERLFN